ncbi:hypothetical protein KR026_001178, partial [Drosophila bipectinata]
LLNLIEDEVMFHQELCHQTSRSRMVLARIRMQQGTQQTASELLLPTWPPYRALCRLFEDYTPWGAVVNLCRYPIATERGFLQPLTNIFGSLIPASLRVAKRHWDLSVEYSVECANMRKELLSTMTSIRKLQLWQSNRRQSEELRAFEE